MVIKAKDNTEKELVFTLVTSAPGGTLGDVSWCKKYIEETLAKYPEDSQKKIKFHLVVTDVSDSTMKKRILTALGDNPAYKVTCESGNDENFFNQPEFKNSDAFVFYAFHLTSSTHLRTIKRLNKPVVIVNHYNFDASSDWRHAQKKEKWMASLYTGFGPGSLGINIENLENKPQDITIPKNDMDVYDLVFGTDSAAILTKENVQEYSERKSLFFGYINKLGFAESKRSLPNPTEFAKACIAKSQQQNPGKEIDILVRLNIPDWWPPQNWFDFRHYAQMESHFRNNHAGLTVAIYKKDAEGKLVLKNTFGDGATKVRIIDPFPLTHDSMITMMQLSDPFCMMTGCESFVEALSCNKLPLYQIVHWHDRLYDELLKEIANIDGLGEESLLYQYFALQNKSKNQKHEALVDLLCEHEPELLMQLQVFKQYLLDNKQLGNTLHQRIDDLVRNPEQYIEQCLGEKHIVDYNDDPELTTNITKLPASIVQLFNIHPDHKETICQNGAQLLPAIANHSGQSIKSISSFVKGTMHFKENAQAYDLLTHLFSRVTDPKVKGLVVSAEWKHFTSQLVTAAKAIKKQYSPDSEKYKTAMEQLTVIKKAQKKVRIKLRSAKSQEEKNKAVTDFHDEIKDPVNHLDNLLGKNLLVKAMECLLKVICAIVGLPVIAVMSTYKKGRKHLYNFFLAPDVELGKAAQNAVKERPLDTPEMDTPKPHP